MGGKRKKLGPPDPHLADLLQHWVPILIFGQTVAYEQLALTWGVNSIV